MIQQSLNRKVFPPLGPRPTRLLPGWGLRLLSSLAVALALRGTGVGEPLSAPAAITPAGEAQEPLAPIPLPAATLTPQTQLGERLFYDPRLSHEDRRSCATCHPLAHGGMDGQPRARAVNSLAYLRNTPTIFNVGLNFWFNWDGSTHTLEAHAEQLLHNPAIMNIAWPELQR